MPVAALDQYISTIHALENSIHHQMEFSNACVANSEGGW
jgi:hypothetical protein